MDEKGSPLFKCNVDKLKIKPQEPKLIIPSNKNNNFKSFSEQTNFKKFNIYLDLNNFDYEINKYNLGDKREFYITGMKKAIETLESLLEVRPVRNFGFSDEELTAYAKNLLASSQTIFIANNLIGSTSISLSSFPKLNLR